VEASAHPECLVCRGQVALAGLLGVSADPGQGRAAEPTPVVDPVRWIELDPAPGPNQTR